MRYCKKALLFVFSLLLTATLAAASPADLSKKNILYISSYNPSFPTFDLQLSGIKSVLPKNYSMDIEYMDTKRFADEENTLNFYRSLQYKLSHLLPYDGIIVADDVAFNFALAYQSELFNEMPIVFLGVNDVEKALSAESNPYMTGVIEVPDIEQTIQAAVKMNPSAESVVALVDATDSGQADLLQYYSYAPDFPSLELKVLDLSNMSLDEFGNELEQLDNSSIVILLSFYYSDNGTTSSFYQGLDYLRSRLNVPLFHPYRHGIGEGILGGSIISHYDQGRSAAEMLHSILSGTDISNIPVIKLENSDYIFDMNVVKQFHIDKHSLPKRAVLLNAPSQFIRENLRIILPALLVTLIELLIIFALLLNMQQRKRLQKKYHELAFIDTLTQLPNRNAIYRTIDEGLKKPCLDNECKAVIFVDIDDFKMVNDTHGHDIGDQLLMQIGCRLKCISSDDLQIGRFGGDEFLIFVSHYASVEALHDNARCIQKVFETPLTTGCNTFYLKCSIGISCYPEHGSSLKDLIKHDDLAMYKAKSIGKNNYVFFESALYESIECRITLQDELAQAIKDQSITLHYQPQLQLNNEVVRGFEQLLRFNSTAYGSVSPIKVIRLSEETGLINSLGLLIAKKSMEFCKSINHSSRHPLTVSINLSSIQLRDPAFFDHMLSLLQETQCNPTQIILEVTETALIGNLQEALDLLNRLKASGFSIALDDFGSGYSSLIYLSLLPFDIIKIDKVFIDKLADSPADRLFVAGIIDICHSKGAVVIAEGVETQAQCDILKSLNCDYIQGFHYSRPLDEVAAASFIQKN